MEADVRTAVTQRRPNRFVLRGAIAMRPRPGGAVGTTRRGDTGASKYGNTTIRWWRRGGGPSELTPLRRRRDGDRLGEGGLEGQRRLGGRPAFVSSPIFSFSLLRTLNEVAAETGSAETGSTRPLNAGPPPCRHAVRAHPVEIPRYPGDSTFACVAGPHAFRRTSTRNASPPGVILRPYHQHGLGRCERLRRRSRPVLLEVLIRI